MGRIYNALAKADRLTDRQRPIGRPNADDAATRRRGDAETGSRPQAARRDSTTPPAFGFGDESHTTASESASGAVSRDVDYLFALSESTGARRATEPARLSTEESVAPSPPRPLAASPRPRVAASSEASPVFEEPCQVVNVKSLMIAPQVAAIAGSDALAAERYRTLAVRISTLAARRKIKSLVVTSADAGEGKSTIAANLAWTLARPGVRRVLLLEANVRAASIHRLLGIQPARGWLSMSDAATESANTLTRVDPNGLYIMTARGTSEADDTDNGALDEALMSARFEKLLTQLAARFDLIVIDAPAICDSAEAQQMAAIADATVMVARAGRTPHRRVSEATDLVPQERRLGVVLNECEVTEEVARRGGKRSLMGRLFRR
ncbi:MAG: protein-tyrosine kinase [Blastocatellia bacterium]